MGADRRQSFLLVGAFVISTLFAGNNAVAVRFSFVELPPFYSAGLRFIGASILFFLIVALMRLPIPRGHALLGVLLFGFLQFGISYVLVYYSLFHVTAGLFQVLLALIPLFTYLFAILHKQEEFEWHVVIGGLIALGGIAVIFGNQLQTNAPLLPMLAVVLASAFSGEALVLYKTFPSAHPITTNALSMAVGAITVMIASLIAQESLALPTLTRTWLSLAYLVVLGSIGVFGLGFYVLSHWKASTTSYQLVIMPVVTVFSASVLANEKITPVLVVGGLLVLFGVYVGVLMPAWCTIRAR